MSKALKSLLYMPASNGRALDKAMSLDADGYIFDLEDAVAPDQKQAARDLLKEKLSQNDYGDKHIQIRVNAVDTEHFEADLKLAASLNPSAILVPKINRCDDIVEISDQLDQLGADKNIKLWAMIETGRSIVNIERIALAQQFTRLDGFVVGLNDLAKELNMALPNEEYPDRLGFVAHLSNIILHAKLNGLHVVDGVYNDLANLDGLSYETKQAKQLGFSGKSLIHPKQVDIVNQIFMPSDEEIKWAQKIVAAFELEENQGKGAISIDGQMVELLHLEIAKKTLSNL